MPNRLLVRTPSPEDRRKARRRASEWKNFRKNYLFTQRVLADSLSCGLRTVVAIEAAEVFWPHADLLRRFMLLKREEEMKAKRYDETMRRKYADAEVA